MLNPFLQTPEDKKRQQIIGGNEEYAAQQHGTVLDNASETPSSMGLLVGRLLVRMGEKLLAKEEPDLKTAREHA